MTTKIKWVSIDYNVIPKKLFQKYGVKPFSIMQKKMRNEKGEVWNNINFFDARKQAKKYGRLFGIKEALLLLEAYKEQNENVSLHDKEFLGIEELSFDEKVGFEWIEINESIAFFRGGSWDNGADAGSFSLVLDCMPSDSDPNIGFRCIRDL